MRKTIGWIHKFVDEETPSFFNYIDKTCSLYEAICFSESFPDGGKNELALKDHFGKDSETRIIFCDPVKYIIEGISQYGSKMILELSKDVFDDVMVHIIEDDEEE